MSRERDQTIALAGLVQALQLVDELASRGSADTRAQTILLDTLFAFDPESTEAVFGRLGNLHRGLLGLRDLLRGVGESRSRQVTRYALSVLLLSRRLERDQARLQIIHERLLQVCRGEDELELDTLAGLCAAIYQDTISTYSHRITVSGQAEQLRREQVAARIRALLLAALRIGILWRQTGGRRWRLLLHRARYLSWCEILIGEAKAAQLH